MAIQHTYLSNHGKKETSILTPTKAIRKKCLDCSGWDAKEVRECTIKDCALYPFRMGKAHTGKQVSDRQKEALGEGLKRAGSARFKLAS